MNLRAQDFQDEEQTFVGQEDVPAWELKKLKPMHLQVCALLAQGMKNVDIARICEITPEYVTMLLRQPLVKQEVNRIAEIAGTRLEAMFVQSVDTIAETMANGSHADKMKAVRLQLEATKRIGRPDLSPKGVEDTAGRLEFLAERLVGLLNTQKLRAGNETAETVSYKEVGVERPVLEATFRREAGQQANGTAEQVHPGPEGQQEGT